MTISLLLAYSSPGF